MLSENRRYEEENKMWLLISRLKLIWCVYVIMFYETKIINLYNYNLTTLGFCDYIAHCKYNYIFKTVGTGSMVMAAINRDHGACKDLETSVC